MDPYSGGTHLQCCEGLQECNADWRNDGRYFFKCFADCENPTSAERECTAQGVDPYHTGTYVACCEGLSKCSGDWDATGRCSFRCYQECGAHLSRECSVSGANPYCTGTYVSCCAGLQTCHSDWYHDGSHLPRCFQDCDHQATPVPTHEPSSEKGCSKSGVDPFATGAHVACCDGLRQCLADWNHNGNWNFKCYQNCEHPYAPSFQPTSTPKSCTVSEADPYSSGEYVECCEDLSLCDLGTGVGTSFRCYSTCPVHDLETSQSPTSLPTQLPSESSTAAPPIVSPTSRPAACTSSGMDPYSGNEYLECCAGLEKCVNDWEHTGRYFFICFSDCLNPGTFRTMSPTSAPTLPPFVQPLEPAVMFVLIAVCSCCAFTALCCYCIRRCCFSTKRRKRAALVSEETIPEIQSHHQVPELMAPIQVTQNVSYFPVGYVHSSASVYSEEYRTPTHFASWQARMI
eukprot:TRINITY_DN75862_c0_g1_i1.p1 TRINITY_DN75862_c0_g1~~TRINITY_DN75862_c0_g1_i1.p1  ORF type:complete len:509 (-),score=42.53 TRINITY_DN75862_c0_g1_i1:146-1519(-)